MITVTSVGSVTGSGTVTDTGVATAHDLLNLPNLLNDVQSRGGGRGSRGVHRAGGGAVPEMISAGIVVFAQME